MPMVNNELGDYSLIMNYCDNSHNYCLFVLKLRQLFRYFRLIDPTNRDSRTILTINCQLFLEESPRDHSGEQLFPTYHAKKAN